jgi:uncharacterized membrane protein
MKKITEKLFEFIERELNNEESRLRIKENILAPSLTLLKDEIDKSGTDTYINSLIQHLLWPVICILFITMILCIIIITLQIYILVR